MTNARPPMTDPTAAAAERMRTVQAMDHQCSPILVINDWQILAEAYLAEHAADDAELIDETWWQTLGPDEDGDLLVANGVWLVYQPCVGIMTDYDDLALPHITTRGQLRLLRRALSQEPQP